MSDVADNYLNPSAQTPGFPIGRSPGLSTASRGFDRLRGGLEECWHWARPQWKDLSLICIFLLLLAALLLFFIIRETDTWATLPGRHGVTLFYELSMCAQRKVLAYQGRRHVAVQQARVWDDCAYGNVSKVLVSEAADQPAEAIVPHWRQSHRRKTQDVMLRLDDGYQLGAAYLPVVVLGAGDYALLTFSVIDALRRTVYAPVTLQLGPDESYPWSTNASRLGQHEDEEHWAEDLFEDFGEDILENLGDVVEDIAEVAVGLELTRSREASTCPASHPLELDSHRCRW